MSWLSELWRRAKGDETDAQLVFRVMVRALTAKQRAELRENLAALRFSVAVARKFSKDARIVEADEWVTGALDILNE